VGRHLWPSFEEVKVINKYTVQFIHAIPDLTLEGRPNLIALSGEVCRYSGVQNPVPDCHRTDQRRRAVRSDEQDHPSMIMK